MSDMQNNRLYKCNVYNPYLDLTRGGSYTRLHVTPGTVPVYSMLVYNYVRLWSSSELKNN